MSRQRRSNIAVGVILILVGAWFLVQRFFPELRLALDLSWPVSIIIVGGVLLLLGLLLGLPGMAVPAAVVAGIGGLLYWQNATGEWSSWAYAWTLIPGFVGVGTLLAGLLGENPRQSAAHGLNLIVISAVLFTIFASIFGGLDLFGPYWPVLLILLGLWLLARAVIYRRK
ncbi:MAG: hypothetical protein JXB15_09195 [Anaerolineales bacterium]|nr:hypothetical protein [Anaerolineales bacterium]